MYKLHDHRPTSIIKKTFEIIEKWFEKDRILVNIEVEFIKNMHEYMDLVHHYEEFSEKEQLKINNGILSQLRDLDKVKSEFYYQMKDRNAYSITELANKFMIIELLEIKESIRIDFLVKINSFRKLAFIDET